MLSLLAAGAGVVSAQKFEVLYWNDANCTVPHVGTGALNTTQLGLAGPMDACINVTAASGVGNHFSANSLVAARVPSSSCSGNNYTLDWNVAETCWPAMALSGGVHGGVASGCDASTSLPGKYYSGSCSTSQVFANAASITITTTFAPMSAGSWSIAYFNDAACTSAWNISGVDVTLDGPMHQCINTTATGSPLSASYKAVDVRDCTGAVMTMNMNLLAHECPATLVAPANVNQCSWSTSFSKYYLAQCSASAWTGDTTRIMTTTHAPLATGNFTLKYYNEANCTTPWLVSGAAVELEGPMGQCVNVTASGSPLASSYKAVDYNQCNGASATMNLGVSTESCASTMAAPVIVGACSWSSSFSKYYMSTCHADGWAGPSTHVVTTTHAPLNAGSWSLKYYDDAACNTPWLLSGAAVEISGPMGVCVNVTATGSPLVASYKAVDFGTCNGATATMNMNLASESCAGSLMAAPVAMNWCSWSTSFSKYFISTCSNATWSGADYTIATTTATPTTTIAAGNSTTGNVTNGEGTTAPANTATVKVQASYEAVEDLPASVTPADLLASTPYMAAKKTGLAAALNVPEADITIDGFSISRRRLAQKGRALASKTVVTSYSVDVPATAAATMQAAVAAPTLAAAIQTQTATAMAAQTWTGEPVLTAAPTLTVSSTTYIGTVTTPAPAAPGTSSAFSIATFGLGAIAMLF